jgi:hypothetical protein
MEENSSASEFKVTVPLLEKFPDIVTEPVSFIVNAAEEFTVIFLATAPDDEITG